MGLRGEVGLVRAQLLIRCICAFLPNLVGCLFHNLVHTEVEVFVALVNCEALPMVDPGK